MSKRVATKVAGLAVVLGTMLALSGCSSLGGMGFDGMTTAALNNPALQPAPPGSPRPTVFSGLGPANAYAAPTTGNTGLVTGPAAQTTLRPPGSVASQDLPVLPNSSESNTMMTAAQPVSPATAPLAAPSGNLVAMPSDAYVHIVQSGESLYTIARHYNVTAQAIIQANGFTSPDRLYVGQKLMIPGRADLNGRSSDTTVALAPAEGVLAPPTARLAPASGTLQAPAPAQRPTQVAEIQQPVATPAPASDAAPAAAPLAKAPIVTLSGADKFRWPVSGRVITDFAASKGTGINIEAPAGTTIRAAEAGQVIYAGSGVEGYGNLILIRHANGYVSAYAHLGQMNVQKGATVNRGDAIGTAGMTGGVSKPQLHFEIRKGATPVDPMPLLAG